MYEGDNKMDITELFKDLRIVSRIQQKLPALFYLAELDSSRAGKVGMEVGSLREKIIIALLMYKFGPSNVDTNIPITEPEVDAKLSGVPLSIKTITGKYLSGVKLIWTVDATQAKLFRQNYYPLCDMILVRINWGSTSPMYLFPRDIQRQVLHKIGRDEYITLPKAGTNPRGVEISKKALENLAGDP